MKEKINAALKESMLAQNKRRTATLRLICAAMKDRDIANRTAGRDCASEDEILQILSKMVKQREESAKIYEEANRLDLSEQEREEIVIISEFLPKQMSQDEVRAACGSLISEIEASGLRDMGRTMNELKSRFPGQMDFGKASGIVKEMLQ